MAILNKDGTVYKIKGSENLVEKKPLWDLNKVILHNLDFEKEEIIISEEPIVPLQPALIPLIKDPIISTQDQKIDLSQKPLSNSFKIHCLPAEIKIYKDLLYDQEHKTIAYGSKFDFDASLVDKTDLRLVIWTARNNIEIGSILFPRTGHVRWWRIIEIEESGLGIRISCEPSDYQPSF